MQDKRLSFADFIVVDYTPGMPDQVSYNAKKRHRGVVGESLKKEIANVASKTKEETDLHERELSVTQRRKLAVKLKKIMPRIKIARQKALRRTATKEKIQRRTEKQVRNAFFKKLAKGKSKGEVSYNRRKEIEKRLERFKPMMKRLVTRKLRDTRKMERERRRKKD